MQVSLKRRLWKPDTAISFVRFGALWKATKRTNVKMKFHFFVLATCITWQNNQTTKRNGRKTSFCRVVVLSFWRLGEVAKTKKWISFLRFFVLSRCSRRQNEQTRKWNIKISFLRLFVLSRWSKHDKTTKRQSYREISKFDFSWLLVRFVVYSFCRLPQGAKTTERQRDKMRFCGHFVLSFVRFVALNKSPKRRNEISFWRLFVLSPSIRRQNEQTKWPYPASIEDSIWINRVHVLTEGRKFKRDIALKMIAFPRKLTRWSIRP